jgi:hypothetical protein
MKMHAAVIELKLDYRKELRLTSGARGDLEPHSVEYSVVTVHGRRTSPNRCADRVSDVP